MYAYYVIKDRLDRLTVGLGSDWNTFTPGTAAIVVHPDLDFHAINGQMFLDNKEGNLCRIQPGRKLTIPGLFILALNEKMAKELLWKTLNYS